MRIKSSILFVPAILLFAACSGKQAPSIVFDAEQHDFGKMKQEEVREHTFRFANTGKADLLIFDVVEGCGCTSSAVSDKIIKPGATGMVHVKFNTEHYLGFQNKYVSVFSNDPAREKVRLTVLAEISK